MAYPALGSLFKGVVEGYKDVSGIIRDQQANEWFRGYLDRQEEAHKELKAREAAAGAAKTTPIPDKAGTADPTAPVAPTPALTKPASTPGGSGSAPASAPASALPVDTRVIDPANLINPAPPMVTGPTVAAPAAPASTPAVGPVVARAAIPPEGSFEANASGLGLGGALDVNRGFRRTHAIGPQPQQPWITSEAPRDIGNALRSFWTRYHTPPGGQPGYRTGGAGGVYPAPQQPFYRPPPPAMTMPGVIGGSQGQVLPDPEGGIQHHTNRTALPVPAQGERPMRYDPATGQLVPW